MIEIRVGDCREVLRSMPDASVHCCVTSPPYFGLRDYGVDGQIGLEPTPDAFVAELVAVFREVRRVLRDDGTLWLNLGDSYASGGGKPSANSSLYLYGANSPGASERALADRASSYAERPSTIGGVIKQKDLIGIPWRVAFALQADGWYLRQDIIWHKPNPMPESVRDRCTKAHEYVYLLAKSERYYYDAAAISEPAIYSGDVKDYTGDQKANSADENLQRTLPRGRKLTIAETRNRRSVWTVPSKPFSGAHFATFPPALIEPCILAGCPTGGTVLDPFGGAGTTGLVADRLQRDAILVELNPAYADIARRRIADESPLFSDVK